MTLTRKPMQSLVLLACCVLLSPVLSLAAGSVRPMHKKQAKEQIVNLEQQWRIATLNVDVPLMDRLLSEDYVGISWTGQVNTKTTQLDRLRKKLMLITALNISDLKVKLLGSVAIVTAHAQVDGANDGLSMKGGYRYTRVYQRLPSGIWKITNFEATRVSALGTLAQTH